MAISVPKNMKKCLKSLDVKTDKKKTVYENIEAVRSYLKYNYNISQEVEK